MRRPSAAASLLVALALAPGCESDAGQPVEAQERIVVRADPDGGFTTVLRGAGGLYESPRDVTVDHEGNVILVGGTQSRDFPTTPAAYQTTFATGGTSVGSHGDMDVFVTKLGPDGSLLWSTFLGGPNYDRAYGVEVDAKGDIYVGGRAGDGFPTTRGALQTRFGGDDDPNGAYGEQDGFVTKLSADGTRLLYSTYLGDGSNTIVRDIDVDAEGQVVAGLPGQGVFPHVTPGAFQTAPADSTGNVIAKLSADGSRVLWATYLSRDGHEGNPSVRIDDRGRVFVLTCSDADGWVRPGSGVQWERAGGTDLLLVRFSKDGVFEASTYLGGSKNDGTETHHLALDRDGGPVIAIATRSTDLAIPAGTTPFQRQHGPAAFDGYLARLSPDLDALLGATYLGNAGRNGGFEGVEVGPEGRIYVGGGTGGGLPPTPGAHQQDFGGDTDGVVLVLTPDLQATYLSYWGGPGSEFQRALAVAGAGRFVSVGQASGDVWVKRFVVPEAQPPGGR